jgi:hypothetical protein
MSPDQLGESRPSVEGPVRNLYFVGHWTRPGGGITPVIVSAMQVANTITKRSMEAAPPLAVLASQSSSAPNAGIHALGSELA